MFLTSYPVKWIQNFNENYNTKVSVDDYAESLHISTNWFIRNFKQYMKISPAQYILSLRMVNAQSLLENTEYNIGEIAEIVGYDNPLYFSRVFKKEYGVSPAQYRKNLEESTEKWEGFLINKESRTMPIKMRSTANKSMTPRMNPSWQSRNFAWNGCMLIEKMVSTIFYFREQCQFF